jgi:predicted ATPase
MERRVVISGCSGGGKSALLEALGKRGYAVVEEPGRRIVREELASNGSALPWIDLAAFAKRAIAMSIADWVANAKSDGWVFFDRSLVDAVSALEHASGDHVLDNFGRMHPYHRRVFLAPSWPEIYVQDEERQHDLNVAAEEYDRLLVAYRALGYAITTLPKTGVAERADFVLRTLNADEPSGD